MVKLGGLISEGEGVIGGIICEDGSEYSEYKELGFKAEVKGSVYNEESNIITGSFIEYNYNDY